MQKTIDVDFLNTFLGTTRNVIKIQASTDPTPGHMSKRPVQDTFSGRITAIVQVESDVFSGSIALSFEEEAFLCILGRMHGQEMENSPEAIENGAKELLKTILTQAKVALSSKGHVIKNPQYSVVLGELHGFQTPHAGLRVAVPFTTDVGHFSFEICHS